jgi:hypothetical protein
MKFTIAAILSLSILAAASGNVAVNGDVKEKHSADLEQRNAYLLKQCDVMLRKADWITAIDDNQVKGFRFGNRFDEMLIQINSAYSDGFYAFTVAVKKNGKQASKTFRITGEIVNDDERLSDLVLSFVIPEAVVREGLGDFRKAFTSILCFGYSRTRDDEKFYPAYSKGNLHFGWRLDYDPSARVFFRDTTLTVSDYFSFDGFFDWATRIRENFFNVDILLYGKNRYSGRPEHGTRLIYGFFNGLEYFRPGFSNTVMKWDREIYSSQPSIQYAIWRALQGNIMVSHRNGSSLYTAGLMVGAGMGIGPSSLVISGFTVEDEKNLSHVFRSIRYRKQNYYFSYTLPARVSLVADGVYDFRFELGYNYYYFYPLLTDNMYDMLHIFKGSIGYYLTYDVMLSAQYEHWRAVSMIHDYTKEHYWNRLIIEFRNYF